MLRALLTGLLIVLTWTALGAAQARASASPEPWLKQTPQELRFATYEIFARHGRPFVDPEWQQYFQQFAWYKPDPAYDDSRLTDAEHVTLRQTLRRRLALARPGEAVDRPLWQAEAASMDKPVAKAYQPAFWPIVGLAASVVVFIFWRKARIPAMIAFVATAVIVGRHVGQVERAKDDVQLDVAYLIQGPIDEVKPRKQGLDLILDGKAYRYEGEFPFRAGEIATLAVSGSGRVLVANGRRVLPQVTAAAP